MANKKYHKLEFPDSGEVLYLPRFSVEALAMKIERKYPAPRPPVQVVDGIREINYSHPDFKQAGLDRYEFIQLEATRLGLEKLRTFKLNAEQKQKLEVWKQENPDDWDSLDKDTDLFLENIAMTTSADFKAWMGVLGIDDERSEEVDRIAEGFKSNS